MKVAAATIDVWSDIGCPWAHLAVHRLHEARMRLGLADTIGFVHRPFPLELFNDQPTQKPILDAKVAALSKHAPSAGWQRWSAPEWQWPVTTLPALEAVQAASGQGAAAADQLDRALRLAFFRDGRCISMRHVVLDVAGRCDAVDVTALAAALDDGRARGAVIHAYSEAQRSDFVKGSPHVFLPDGSDAHNPGIRMHWEDKDTPHRRVVIDADDPSVYDGLLQRAAAVAA